MALLKKKTKLQENPKYSFIMELDQREKRIIESHYLLKICYRRHHVGGRHTVSQKLQQQVIFC